MNKQDFYLEIFKREQVKKFNYQIPNKSYLSHIIRKVRIRLWHSCHLVGSVVVPQTPVSLQTGVSLTWRCGGPDSPPPFPQKPVSLQTGLSVPALDRCLSHGRWRGMPQAVLPPASWRTPSPESVKFTILYYTVYLEPNILQVSIVWPMLNS